MDTAAYTPETAAAEEAEAAAPAPAAHPPTRMTRLLCARLYLYGALVSAPTLFFVTRPIFHARDPGIGYDKRMVLFHALQSLMLSLLFAVPALLVLVHREPPEEGGYGMVGWLSLAVAVFKVGVLNPTLARAFFARRHQHRHLRLPLLGALADALARWMLPTAETEDANASYFAGDRPFTGYGTEINAWTLVVDTSAPAKSVHDFTDNAPDPTPIEPADLYRAVMGCTALLQVENLSIGWRTFLKGTSANEQRQRNDRRFARPPQRLSPQWVDEIDREGENGRRYMVLTMEKPSQDLIATQFVRFQLNGKLMFCEFASYVLAPGLKGLYRMDWLFGIQLLVYLLFGLGLFVAGTVLSSALLYGWGVLRLVGQGMELTMLLDEPALLVQDLFRFATSPGTALLSLSITVVAFSLAFVAWRLLRGLASMVGLLTSMSRQFGVAFSYRERFTSRGSLDYYCLQDVACFMKTQEKILVKTICDQLHLHGIDASDFKESLSAYINQGVINSGDIRGNVLSSVKSFVFRRPARSAGNRSKRKVANG